MQRSGGRVGQPFGHVSIDQLEATVRSYSGEGTELLSVLGELGFRKSPRAQQLKSLVQRLLRAKSASADEDMA